MYDLRKLGAALCFLIAVFSFLGSLILTVAYLLDIESPYSAFEFLKTALIFILFGNFLEEDK